MTCLAAGSKLHSVGSDVPSPLATERKSLAADVRARWCHLPTGKQDEPGQAAGGSPVAGVPVSGR